jgi:dTDP-4-amino-4,6-dideoxygalactose transaminase
MSRDKVVEELGKRGIGSMCYYPVALHEQQAFKNLGYKRGDFPVSEKLADQVISIPMYPELKVEQIEYVGKSLQEIMTSQATFGIAAPAPVMVV